MSANRLGRQCWLRRYAPPQGTLDFNQAAGDDQWPEMDQTAGHDDSWD